MRAGRRCRDQRASGRTVERAYQDEEFAAGVTRKARGRNGEDRGGEGKASEVERSAAWRYPLAPAWKSGRNRPRRCAPLTRWVILALYEFRCGDRWAAWLRRAATRRCCQGSVNWLSGVAAAKATVSCPLLPLR